MVLLLCKTLTNFVYNLAVYSSILFYSNDINQPFKFFLTILLVP